MEDNGAANASPQVAHQLHVTRSTIDLRDRVVEIHDARDLGFPTWRFAYDLAGRRVLLSHATAIGDRFTLTDAAGNAIWSRDARGLEIDRRFDVLNRPLTEITSDGKLRRFWRYAAYDPADRAGKARNIFGRIEEQRDADGLRFFDYDWRGLVIRASHRFWDAA